MPMGAWEPGDRGSAPGALGPWSSKSPMVSARASTQQQQLDALAERIGAAVAGLQRQCDTDKRAVERRLQQVEREMKSAIGRMEGDHARETDWREKLVMLPGEISGLAEESQALARRVDGLDERLWARTSGAEEIARQGVREVTQQLQAFERKTRLTEAAAEEAQKRQATRQRRFEHMLEDLFWRLSKAEEQWNSVPEMSGPRGVEVHLQGLELRLQDLGDQVDDFSTRIQEVEAQLADPKEAACLVAGPVSGAACLTVNEESHHVNLETVERDFSAQRQQIEDLSTMVASLRVKVDGQVERHKFMAERLETAHVPAIEALKTEFVEAREKDLCGIQGRLAELDQRLALSLEASDSETMAEQILRLGHRVSGSEVTVAEARREVNDLRAAHRAVLEVRSRGGGPPADMRGTLAGPSIQDQLGAVADQLEALDEVAQRVSELDQRVSGLEQREQHQGSSFRKVGDKATCDSEDLLVPSKGLQSKEPFQEVGELPVEKLAEQLSEKPWKQPLAAELSISRRRREPFSAGGTYLASTATRGEACASSALSAASTLPAAAEVGPSQNGIVGASTPLPPLQSPQASSSQPRTPLSSATLAPLSGQPLGTLKPSMQPVYASPSLDPPSSLSTATLAPSASESLAGARARSSLVPPAASTPPPGSSPQLSRKQSLDSSFSCDVVVAGDELVDDTLDLQERCDITVEVVSPTGRKYGAGPSLLAEVEASGSEGFEHEEFEEEDDDLGSLDESVAESGSIEGPPSV